MKEYQLESRSQRSIGIFNIALYVYAESREKAVEIANKNGYETRGDQLDCNINLDDVKCEYLSQMLITKDIKENEPIHEHDCNKCIYLGTALKCNARFGEEVKATDVCDLYYCPSSGTSATLIARNGDCGNYASGGVFSWNGGNADLIKARKLAIKKGHLTNEEAFSMWHPEWVGERPKRGD